MAALGNPKKAENSARFFKTGKGQYGEGDVFLGLTVPEQRILAKRYKDLDLKSIQSLLESPIHEHRCTGLIILVGQFEKGDTDAQNTIADFYLKHLHCVNNWDLVDGSAPYILGTHLLKRDRSVLYELVKSHSLWERRIAMLACFAFIKARDFKDALAIATLLLNDKEDLIHKAVGWMLRELGKIDFETELKFLRTHKTQMPRTALRYAIERFPIELKKELMA